MLASSLKVQEQLLREHSRIFGLAAELNALLASAIPVDPDVLAKARWSFASALMQHLAVKERYIYAKLEQDRRPQVEAFYASSKSDLLGRFAAYTQHMENWPTARALAEWSTYCPNAAAVVDRFVERLKHEETELFETLNRFDVDISFPSTVTSNWVRKAFDVKDKVHDKYKPH